MVDLNVLTAQRSGGDWLGGKTNSFLYVVNACTPQVGRVLAAHSYQSQLDYITSLCPPGHSRTEVCLSVRGWGKSSWATQGDIGVICTWPTSAYTSA